MTDPGLLSTVWTGTEGKLQNQYLITYRKYMFDAFFCDNELLFLRNSQLIVGQFTGGFQPIFEPPLGSLGSNNVPFAISRGPLTSCPYTVQIGWTQLIHSPNPRWQTTRMTWLHPSLLDNSQCRLQSWESDSSVQWHLETEDGRRKT